MLFGLRSGVVFACLLGVGVLLTRWPATHQTPAPVRSRLLVAKTSVDVGGGLGLYAISLLTAGERVARYPGRVLTPEQHDGLLAALNSNVDRSAKGLEVLYSPLVLRLRHKFDVVTKSQSLINWAQLKRVFESYRFGFPTGVGEENVKYVVWMRFDGDSCLAIVDASDEDNAALFINEPPPKDFYNSRLGKQQKTEASVVARNIQGGVELVAMRDIQPGEEVLVCYGPHYAELRSYGISDDACPDSLWGL